MEEGRRFRFSDGDEIAELYSHESTARIDFDDEIGSPGKVPFTRGIHPTMYRGRLWTMRQYAGFGTAEDANRRYRYLLKKGQTGLSVAFDLPTQMGYDSDDPIAGGEVGRVGVSVDTIDDLDDLFRDIPLEKISVSMTINATAPMILAMFVALAARRGIPLSRLRGTIQNDILKEYVARGTYIFPPEPSIALTVDLFEFCASEMPEWNSISVSGYHIREAGADAVQELAFTIADGLCYLEKASEAGLDLERFASRMSFFFACHNNFFEEIAKFRAARKIWAGELASRFRISDPRSLKLRFHTQTAGSTLQARQPRNNIVRVAMQALAAVLGGTQSLHTNSMDEALALPTESSAELALRTQQIIAYESGAADVVDPLGGSFMLESLTKEMERKVLLYLGKIDEMGGVLKCVSSGYFQGEIEESSYTYQKEFEQKSRVIVGVNKFESREEEVELLQVDSTAETRQIERLSRFRSERDNARVNNVLDGLRIEALKGKNIMPPLIDAVDAGATMGETVRILEELYGRWKG